ncbi:MAG: EAL domain-containing protein [Campylobacterota bacterium]|nr:EAL domain-containing protein [Campylobacterota bacterium]
MEHLQTLTIAYECESSLGNSLSLKTMTKEFLRVFLKKTSALYAVINEFHGEIHSHLNSVGKDEFYELIVSAKADEIDKFSIVNITKDKITYQVLYVLLDGYYLAFVYSQKNQINIKIIANIFYSLRKKIELGIKSCIEHERLALALLGSNDGIWDWNLVDNSICFTPRWKEMIGYRDDEIPNEFATWKDRVHPDDLQNTIQSIEDNISGKTEHYENIYRLKHKDGHWIWNLDQGITIYDEDGTAIRMIGTHTDITDEKEMQLKSIHQAQIIEQIHDSVISTNLDGNIISFNAGSELLLGYRSDEIIGQHITVLYLKEDFDFLKKNIEMLMKNGEHQANIRLVKKSKQVIDAHLSLSLLKDQNGNPIGMVGYSQDITLRLKAEKKLREQKDILHHQAYHDSLTGLPNRSLFQDRLEQSIEKAKRNRGKIALFFIDLDHFKEINDSLGHEVGDTVLKMVTQRLESAIRKEDTLARLGGDEFTVMIEHFEHAQSATLLAEKILASLKEAITIDSHTLYVSSSIGISLYPQDGKDYESLLKYADAAMYKAKNEGRNNFQFYSAEMTELAFERVVMQASLNQAIKDEEFVVFYQPQIDAKLETFVGVEALIRWQHPTMGLVSPVKFIPLAEETGLIVEMDQWVMRTVMSQMDEWYSKGLRPGKLALNLSMKQLRQENFISILEESMKNTGFKAKDLELEVTEGQIMTNPEEAIKILKKISDIGIELAVDDFGTGYSSLSYLKKLPINKLKIDQSFIRDLPDDEDDVGITKAVISLSQSLKLNVIAEGVETNEQKNFLLKNGCETIQGYLYGRPMPADELTQLLQEKAVL